MGGGKGKSKAPAPDPNIGLAAMKQAEIAGQWLDFAREQFGVANERQQGIDDLAKRVTEQQLAAQDQASKWAAEDREIQQGYRNKYDQWAEQDRATGQKTRDELNQIAKDAISTGKGYEEAFNKQASDQFAFAKEQQDRYRDTFQPVEDRFAQDAMTWDSADRQNQMAAQAKADVVGNAAAAQQQSQRQMSAMGVNPNSGRFGASNRASNLNTALAAAGAQNQARDTVRQQGLALRGQAVGIGQNVAQMGQQAQGLGMQATSAAHTANQSGTQQALQAKNMGLAASGIGNTAAQLGMGNQGGGYQGLGLGVNAGSAAMGNKLGANSAWQNGLGIMTSGFGGAMQGYGSQASILNQQYANQLNAWNAQQQANAQGTAGLWSGLGTVAGLGMMAFSSKELKEDKAPVEGALDAVNAMPVEEWSYKEGVADEGRHIGPYAEDFQAATGMGDGKTINLIDAVGVNMKAVQELDQKVEKLARSIGKRPQARRSERRAQA
ncbi:hypothetical protein [Pseudomonas phage Itty13]|uniref:Peptidase S74 domain-containing protein n=1 Tax=Pseudomonas phage Itty13 TaxID=2805750 RepID=A0A889IQD0_9CAUD|nr:hypothetical protein PQC19_gp06 [Pseudomonas phage Itty13]QRE00582.1 hypothetical protein [Pseudomonas phage Itty13]